MKRKILVSDGINLIDDLRSFIKKTFPIDQWNTLLEELLSLEKMIYYRTHFKNELIEIGE